QSRASYHLERLQADVLELTPARLEPARLGARQQASSGDVERNLGQGPCAARVALRQRVLGALDLRRGRLQVDPHGSREIEDELVTPDQRVGPKRRSQAREERSQ